MFVLSVLWSNIVKKPKPQQQRLLRLRADLQAESTGVVEIPRSAFLKASTPIKLLALAGLRSCINSTWRSKMLALLRYENLDEKLSADGDFLRNQIASELNVLTERR